MRVVLINPPIDEPNVERKAGPPLGLAYLASVLINDGCDHVAIVDGFGEGSSAKEIAERVASDRPDVMGLTVHTRGLRPSVEIARAVREACPQTRVVFGGYHPSAMHKEVLEDFGCVDFVVRGEAEETFPALLKTLANGRSLDTVRGLTFRNNGRVRETPAADPPADLDALPFPARHLLGPVEHYSIKDESGLGPGVRVGHVISSRGCPYKCAFCCVLSIRGSKSRQRFRSPANCADEIEQLVNDYGAEHIQFRDDNFYARPHRALAILQECWQRGLRPTYGFPARADTIVRSRSVLHTMRQLGTVFVEVGIENGSQAVLDRYKKDLQVEDIERAIDILGEEKLIFRPNFIMWNPDTTIAELKENIAFIKRNALYRPQQVSNRLYPYPGTAVYEELARKSRLLGDRHEPDYRFASEEVTRIYEIVGTFNQVVLPSVTRLTGLLQDIVQRARNSGSWGESGVLEKAWLQILQLQAMGVLFLEELVKSIERDSGVAFENGAQGLVGDLHRDLDTIESHINTLVQEIHIFPCV